jgi:CheY-like chemotaxis protein
MTNVAPSKPCAGGKSQGQPIGFLRRRRTKVARIMTLRRLVINLSSIFAVSSVAPVSCTNVKRVTVVDDDQDICTLVHHRLTTMGMDVEAYSDGRCGLDAIVARPPDLAIIDVMMPKMNGLEVTRAIRATEATKDLPVVIFSALVRPEDQEAGLTAGANHYVIKPFRVSELGAFVDKLLGLRTCTVCGTRRTEDDVELSVQQVLQHTKLGWTATSYGDICGVCFAKAFKKFKW